MLRDLLKSFPIYGTGFKTDFSELIPFLEQREIANQAISLEGNWKHKLNLNQTLRHVQSYLALGFPYPVFYPKIRNGTLSCYSVITDYHLVLRQRLEELQSSLEKIYPGEEFKILVDSGKVFEKQLGASANIGFIGKNTLLIHPVYGSYFFIGLILSTVRFPEIYSHPEQKKTGGCGNCSICLCSCPSQALKPYVLNATKCFSYLSQSKKEESPPCFLWGCDLCQMGCPYNLKRKREVFPGFQYLFDSLLLEPGLLKKDFHSLTGKLPIGFGGYAKWMGKIQRAKISLIKKEG